MSSLWTPGGEVPVDRSRPSEEPGDVAPASDAADDEAVRASYEEMTARLLEVPAADVIVQQLMAFYELAVLHLSQPEPDLDAARLAIDTLAAVVDGVGDRLGPAGEQLAAVLPQLRLAFVERTGT